MDTMFPYITPLCCLTLTTSINQYSPTGGDLERHLANENRIMGGKHSLVIISVLHLTTC